MSQGMWSRINRGRRKHSQRLAKGLCVRCGHIKHIEGKTRCVSCQQRDREYYRTKRPK